MPDTVDTTAPIAILTDSYAHLPLLAPPALPDAGLLTIVPNKVHIGGKTIPETELSPEEPARAGSASTRVVKAYSVEPPSVGDYVATYTRAARDARTLLSIHASRELSASWQHGKAAAAQIAGRANIIHLDSRTVGAAQSLLVQAVVRAITAGESAEAAVRRARHTAERVYSIYYVESMDTLLHNKLIAPSHAMLGTMLGVKPVLTVEQGRLTTMEKVKTRVQAIEQLVAFAVELADIEAIYLFNHRSPPSETARLLYARLEEALPNLSVGMGMYGTSLAALIGTDGVGLAIIEREHTEAAFE